MSLDIVSEKVSVDRSGYAQEQTEAGSATSGSTKNSFQVQEGRSDKDLRSASSTQATSANKTHIAFALSFTIKIANRTPFDPNHPC